MALVRPLAFDGGVSPRKTPVQRRSATTVDCILEAAAHILAADGLGGLSTNAVARRAGTSIGSLYQYFPGKDAIVSALILRGHDAIVAGARRLVDDTRGLAAPAAIAAMADMVLAAQPASPRLARILEAEEERLARTPAIVEAEQAIDALNRDFLRGFLDPGVGEDELAVAALEMVAIVRALLDAGGGGGGGGDLRARIVRTVEGYLAPLLATTR